MQHQQPDPRSRQQIVFDQRFLRQFSRRILGMVSRCLDGHQIVVRENGPHLEVHISTGAYSVLVIDWTLGYALLRPGSRLLAVDRLCGIDEELTELVGRFLRKHRFIDRSGASTRRYTA